MTWAPLAWLRTRAAWLRKRAEVEQDLADAEAFLAEVRKRAAIQRLEIHLSTEDVLDILRHDLKLKKLARNREYGVAVDAFYRDHMQKRDREWVLVPASGAGPTRRAESDSPLELALATVVVVGFLIFVYFFQR